MKKKNIKTIKQFFWLTTAAQITFYGYLWIKKARANKSISKS